MGDLAKDLSGGLGGDYFVAASAAMQEVYGHLELLAENKLPVIIKGESGVGKEVIANTMHKLSRNESMPFVAVNIAAVPVELLEAELLGYEQGAFEWANENKAGIFEQAGGGTLFLNKIGDIPQEAQLKLLKILRHGEYSRIGSAHIQRIDVRIICSTSDDLSHLVRSGQFNEELYYLLNVSTVQIPALRERREDIIPLANHFLCKAQGKGLSPKTLHPEAMKAMSEYEWMGNVRELENMMYRLSALYFEDVISKEAFLAETNSALPMLKAARNAQTLQKNVEEHLNNYFAAHNGHSLPPSGLYYRILPLVEKPLIELTLKATGGNQLKAAHVLGINRNTLRKKITELGISIDD